MSRSDLLQGNYNIIKAVVGPVVKHSPDAILIIVTNPLDAMAQRHHRGYGVRKLSRAISRRRSSDLSSNTPPMPFSSS